MKKILALVLVFVLCLALWACGSNNGIVGTWRTYIVGTTYTFVFKNNNTYTYTYEGAFNMNGTGTYVLNEENGTIILTNDDGEITQTVQIRDCCMILNQVKYGKAYTERENCEVLDILLGKWEHPSLENTYLEFYKNGTYKLMFQGEVDTGLYIYDPVEGTVHITDASLTFKFSEQASETHLYATDGSGLYFRR